jgi:hypothetical protein
MATPTFGRLRAGDVEIVQEPTEQPYAVRDCPSAIPQASLIRSQQRR